MVRSLAQLHGLGKEAVDEVAALDGLPVGGEPEQAVDGEPEQAIETQLRRWHEVYRSAVDYPIPLLARSFAWLRAHLRATTAPSVVVHGDPGPGSALQNEDGVAAVIDWELAHVGDAAEDWAHLALVRGRRPGSAKLEGPACRRVPAST
jgi:aminoglycoside phosphotransferase (APT) family kinase protein